MGMKQALAGDDAAADPRCDARANPEEGGFMWYVFGGLGALLYLIPLPIFWIIGGLMPPARAAAV